MEQRPQHFLVVTYPAQGNINPSLHLAKRLAHTTGGRVTFSTAISAHRRMFPSLAKPDEEVEDGLLSYIPYSDGYDNGFKFNMIESGADDFMSQFKLVGTKTLSSIVRNLSARDRPVSCIIYTILLSWAADVASEHRIPSAHYWIQPATVFATYYHYFHGYDELIISHGHDPMFTVDLPGLPPLQIRDLPSFFTITSSNDPYYSILVGVKETFDALDREEKSSKPRVLINTFDALEVDAIKAVGNMDLIAIGPLLPSLSFDGKDSKDGASCGDLFKPDPKGYMEWLDSKPEKSVVYVSFGSLSVMKKQQLEEILRGLKESGRPYLCVVRKDSREEGIDELEDGENGMVVEWCSQVKVLSHPSVGCFVTHCGWNSTLESLTCGVPMIGVPQWTDQGTNARLVEAWGIGVRSELDSQGLLEGSELRRCLELVMGEGEKGMEIRRMAEMWRDRAREAVHEGGSSYRNFMTFVEGIANDN